MPLRNLRANDRLRERGAWRRTAPRLGLPGTFPPLGYDRRRSYGLRADRRQARYDRRRSRDLRANASLREREAWRITPWGGC